jgi:hypothetical protein
MASCHFFSACSTIVCAPLIAADAIIFDILS